jgi:hypothetical protein
MAPRDRDVHTQYEREMPLRTPAGRGLVSLGAGSSVIARSSCRREPRVEEGVRAETTVREGRAFEFETLPRFELVLCSTCTRPIQARSAPRLVAFRADMLQASGGR